MENNWSTFWKEGHVRAFSVAMGQLNAKGDRGLPLSGAVSFSGNESHAIIVLYFCLLYIVTTVSAALLFCV